MTTKSPLSFSTTVQIFRGFAFLTSSSSSQSCGLNWLGTWNKRCEIIIDSSKVDGRLDNFPVLIHLSSSSGISAQDVTDVFTDIGSNDKKIAVTECDGDTQIYVEVERWNYTGTPSTSEAWLWVKVPWIQPNEDTYIYLYCQ